MDSPEVWLDRVLAASDPWLVADTEPLPPGLVEVVEDRFPGTEQRRLLVWLLGRSGEDGVRALARLLETAAGIEAVDLLATLAHIGPTHASPATVRRLLADPKAGRVAADLAGLSGDHSFVPDLVPLLDDRERGGNAAIALGRLHAHEHTARIARRLRRLKGLERQRFVIALELMGDPAAVPELLRGRFDGEVHHALAHLTGRHPLVENLRNPRAIRAAWRSVDVTEPARPDLRDVQVGETRADFVLDDGLGRILIDDDPPTPGSLWPRWGRSLMVAGTPVYNLGSTCGTCELTMRLTGWPPESAVESSTRLRDRLADLPRLDADLIDAARPLLVAMPTGHYRTFLLDLDLERVSDPEMSWWHRRTQRRGDNDDDELDEPYWPGAEHFQLRDTIPGSPPAYCVVMPSRSPELLRDERVAEHAAAIAAGARPAALLWGWVDDRYVQAEHHERFLVAVVLDGHHKLTAYARAGVPARVVMLSRTEDNWGPPEDRDRYLIEVTAPLRTAAS
ncbi:MAG: hypothetical protein ACRDSK_14480 [Actinophytocola sp.]|uniref:hypothetical protein n=1 Tax=Actinophytocola sp. TaxID=1872138 RepID=UPI003D6BFC39